MAQVETPMVQVRTRMAQVRKKCAHRRHQSTQNADLRRRYVGENPTCAVPSLTCTAHFTHLRHLTCSSEWPSDGHEFHITACCEPSAGHKKSDPSGSLFC